MKGGGACQLAQAHAHAHAPALRAQPALVDEAEA
jgi:hypothetical protein